MPALTDATTRTRVWIIVLALLLLGGGATAYTLRTASGRAAATGTSAEPGFVLDGGAGALYARDSATGRVARVDPAAPGGRTARGPACDRFHAAGGTALCLQRRPGVPA
ncbi:hypothetical protein ACFWEN_41875, partial [Streptomyces anthocyanicus]